MASFCGRELLLQEFDISPQALLTNDVSPELLGPSEPRTTLFSLPTLASKVSQNLSLHSRIHFLSRYPPEIIDRIPDTVRRFIGAFVLLSLVLPRKETSLVGDRVIVIVHPNRKMNVTKRMRTAIHRVVVRKREHNGWFFDKGDAVPSDDRETSAQTSMDRK